MIMRSELYSKEAASLLHTVSMYKVALEDQLVRMYRKKPEVIKNLLQNLVRQGRIVYDHITRRYAATDEDLRVTDASMLKALWVLVDMIDKVEFHTASDYPVKIVLFSDGAIYEIIHVPYDNEMLISHALTYNSEDELRRIIIVDKPEQIPLLQIELVAGFCTVEQNGSVRYFKLS